MDKICDSQLSSSEMRSKDLKEITGLLPPDTAAQLKYWVCLQVTRYFMPTRSSHWHVYTSQLNYFWFKKKCKNTHTHLAHWRNNKKNEAFKSTNMGVEGREKSFAQRKSDSHKYEIRFHSSTKEFLSFLYSSADPENAQMQSTLSNLSSWKERLIKHRIGT